MKRIFPILLAAAMLLSVFCACGESAAPADVTDAQAAADADVTTYAAEETTAPRTHSLPDGLDFDGETFRVFYPDWRGWAYYYIVDEQNGEAMNDAVWERQSKISEELNVTFERVLELESSMPAKVKTLVLAGESSYDLVLGHCIREVANLSSGGYLYNWDDLPYVDYSAEWWNTEQMDMLRLGKGTYFGVSDFNLPCPFVIFFNKDIVADYTMDSPYDLVKSGKWTLDAFLDMCEKTTVDLNGDGKMDSQDQYGLTTNGDNAKFISFMTSCDQFMTSRDDDGRIVLDLNGEKIVSIVEKMYRLYDQKLYYANTYFDAETAAAADAVTFETGRVLFYMSDLGFAQDLRECDSDYGLIPFPKYNESQEEYRTLEWNGLTYIPNCLSNPEKTGAVEELLAFYAADTVIPAYYDITLVGKLSRDADSAEMLDLIFDTICFEIGGNYFGFHTSCGALFYTISNTAIAGSTDFASFYAKYETNAIAEIEKFYTVLDAYENS